MVQQRLEPYLCDLKIDALSGVDVNDAVARLQSRGDVSDNQIFEILPRFSITAGPANPNWDCQYTRRRDEVLNVTGGGDVAGVIIGCELIAFERDRDEPAKQLHFPASVDFVVWRRSILLIGLSSSEMILVDPNLYTIIYAWKAVPDRDTKERFYVDAFIHSTPDPTKIDVMVVSREGLVCTFREIALSDGCMDATHDQNQSLDVDLGSIKDISKHTLSISSKVACVCSPARNILILIEEAGNLLMVDLASTTPMFYVVSNVLLTINPVLNKSNVLPKKMSTFEGNLFLLLSNGVLEIFTELNAYTSKPLRLSENSSSVHDFSLVRNNNELTVKLWVLYSEKVDSKVINYLGIYGGPCFSLEFSFQLPFYNKTGEPSYYRFSKNLGPYEEPTTIIEMAPDSVLMYHILETTTDVTLQKLLSRGKYLEAKDLALNYNKDLDIVRKAEARDKLNKLAATDPSDTKKIDLLWNELLEILREITDAEFVCKFCVSADLPRMGWVKEILTLGKGRVSECPATAAANSLLLTFKKLYTFELVYPSGTINEWKAFISKENTMFLQSLKFLQDGSYEKCERIWRRHWEEFVSTITLMDFLPFFNVLFDHQLRTCESVSLFKTILPFAVGKVVQSDSANEDASPTEVSVELDVLFGIIQRQVSTLESKIDWPMNALKFIKVLSAVIKEEIKRLEISRNEQAILLKKKKLIVEQLSAQLDRLEQILEELAELKKNHSIRILFHDYTNNEIPEVINKLLYKLLSQEEVENFVSNYLRPYAKRKNLDVDYLFTEHIKSVVQFIHYYIQAINIPHEERITCLVNLIISIKTKLECALIISKEWPVPWTPGINGMVDRVLSIPRMSLDRECAALYDEIITMKKQVPYRCVLNKYRLNSSKLLKRRVYVSMALLRILKLKKPGFYEDCTELLKHVPSKTLIDAVHLQYIEFILRLYDEDVDEEEVPLDDVKANSELKRAVIRRAFLELQQIETANEVDVYTEQEQKRFIKIFKLLANESNDSRNSMICKLKQFLPEVQLDIVYKTDFPYACLSCLFDDSQSLHKDPVQLINDCKVLSQITQTYLSDMLIAVGAYFTQEGLLGNPSEILWKIVEYIVSTPLDMNMSNTIANRELLEHFALNIARFLMYQCPSLSIEQMHILQEFLCRLSSSFDKVCIDIGHLLCYFRMFLNLKEQEIPLEDEFRLVYVWLTEGQASWETVKNKLNVIAETLVKFGEIDLCSSVIKAVIRHLQILTKQLEIEQNSRAVQHYHMIMKSIEDMKNDMISRSPKLDDDESDSQMKKLVEDLNEAGIRVNAYALKLRNKLTLLERLLKLNAHNLAAELAITFSFYDNHQVWSEILKGLVASGNLDDLRRVLERISMVPQLWMLPEFAVGWKKVSEVDSGFFHLCPIPLD